MRANRSTLVKLCLLTALAVPVQRAASASMQPLTRQQQSPQLMAQALAAPDVTLPDSLDRAESLRIDGSNNTRSINQALTQQFQARYETAVVAQLTDFEPTATSADGNLTARTDDENLAVIEDANGTLVAGPLTGADGAVTALAFSEDGRTLATGTNTGKVRYWGVDGEPKGEAFQAVLGEDNAITELRFEGNDKLLAAGSQGRRGFWGLNGFSYGEGTAAVTATAADTGTGAAPTAADQDRSSLGWLLLPLLALGAGGLWLWGRRSQTAEVEPKRQTAPTATVPPPVNDPETNREVSNRAQSVISTDRVADDSRTIPPSEPITTASLDPLPVGLPGLETESTAHESTVHESTDLESPDLEGTNLDLSTPAALSGAALGGIALGAIGLDAGIESDDDEEWDDNLNLTLDDTPTEEAEIALAPAVEPGVEPGSEEDPALTTTNAAIADPEDFWAIATEPTRDTVIADLADISAPEVALTIEPTRETIIGDSAVIFDGAAAPMALGTVAAGLGAESTARISLENAQSDSSDSTLEVTEDEYESLMSKDDLSNVPDTEPAIEPLGMSAFTPAFTTEELASVDEGLRDLPDGYGDSRLVLLPRDPKWAYAYWDISNEHKEELRQQGGQRLMLRLYDVTDINQSAQSSHSMQQYDCHEMARSWYIEIPVSDRDYTAEIGYLTDDDRWLILARSAAVRVPPIYPSAWIKDRFATVDWSEPLAGRTVADLGRPDEEEAQSEVSDRSATEFPPVSDALFALTQEQAALRVAGSLFGSGHQLPPGALSDSGMTVGGIAAGQVSSFNLSGLTMSGVGMGSGGFETPERSRKFWLVADAELIVYGATEPDATLTIGDRTVPLNPDGTFRFHISFPDGTLHYPIRAVATDGEQSRSITLNFERNTPERNTNTKADAQDEWF